MLYLILLALCAAINPSLWAETKAKAQPEFVILVLSYNNEKYVRDNMRWVCYQNSSRPYQVICVNDCSSDKTGELMEKYVREHSDMKAEVKIIHNTERKGMTRNTYETIHDHISDHKIVVKCDGDDVLANNNVLMRLEKEYKKPHIWLTYGQAVRIPGGELLSKKIPEQVFFENSHRKWGFTAVALRTFKAKLFKKIKKEDLMHEGRFYWMSGDEAYMFPMLEMSSPVDKNGINHTVFIPNILYFYNVVNPLNDHAVNKPLQTELAKIIRSKPSYKPIAEL